MAGHSDSSAALKERIIRHMNADHHDSLVDYLRFYAQIPAREAASAELVDINTGGMTLTRVIEPNGPPRPVVIPIEPPMDSLKQSRERLVAMAFEAMEGLGKSRYRVESYPSLSFPGIAYGVLCSVLLAFTLFPNETLRPGTQARRLVLRDSETVARWLFIYRREIRSAIMGCSVYFAVMPMRRRLQRHSYKSSWGHWVAWFGTALFQGPLAFVQFDRKLKDADTEASSKKH